MKGHAARRKATILVLSACMFPLSSCGKKTTAPVTSTAPSATAAAEEDIMTEEPAETASAPSEEETVLSTAENYGTIIGDLLAPQTGECYYGIHLYRSGYQYQTQSKRVPSASVIKVFIMEYAFWCVGQGDLALNTVIGGKTLSQLLESMITYSDNSAANTLISYFSMDKLNDFFKSCGYENTLIQRKMLDYQAMEEGKDNYTSVSDVMKFLDKLYLGKNETPYCDMLEIMKRQQIKTKIQRDLPSEVVAANKTGELSTVENDIGILFTPNGDLSIAFLTCKVTDTAGMRTAIARATRKICEQVLTE